MGVAIWLENAINLMGRSLEFALTGQSNFRINLGDSAKYVTINEPIQAKIAQDDVRLQMRELFGIDFRWPILVDLKQPPPLGWKATFYNPDGNLGRYTMQELRGYPTHQLQIAPGMTRLRFCALLAHELTHAYQREMSILASNQALREGMARWVEWHFLKRSKVEEAQKLLKIKHYTFGRAIDTIVEFEKIHGRSKTMEWLCQHP